MKKIAIFVSGKGSLIKSFHDNEKLEIAVVVANRDCEGVNVARGLGLEAVVSDNFGAKLAEELNGFGVEVVVLAGFLKVVPSEFLNVFEGEVVNVHPSLLPKYGGIGFYGEKVLRATLEAGDREAGITIHKVTEDVDRGPTIAQYKILVDENESLESLMLKIFELENSKYVEVVENM